MDTDFDITGLINAELTSTSDRKIQDLTTPNLLILVAKCKKTISQILQLKRMKDLQNHRTFNLDTFPKLISPKELEYVHLTIPEIEVLKGDLRFIKDHFFDALEKFQNLRKLHLFLNEDYRNYNDGLLSIESLTIRATFNQAEHDVLFNLLKRFSWFRCISLYDGFLTTRSMALLEDQGLRELKLQNVNLHNMKCNYLIKVILENRALKKLKLVSFNYTNNPHPIIAMSDILGHLPHYELNLETLKFTLDQHKRIRYENLRYLKKLKELTIYYNVLEETFNLEKAIIITSALGNVKVKFIEYAFSSTQPNSIELIEKAASMSRYYVEFIQSMDNYVETFPIDYENLYEKVE